MQVQESEAASGYAGAVTAARRTQAYTTRTRTRGGNDPTGPGGPCGTEAKEGGVALPTYPGQEVTSSGATTATMSRVLNQHGRPVAVRPFTRLVGA